MARQLSSASLPSIEQMIVLIRGEQVILDADLALLYRVKTNALLQAVKRNPLRFPEDFVFQLTDAEWTKLAARGRLSGCHGGRRHRPYAFTEQGAAMVASVLHNPIAIHVGITILRTFARLHKADEAESPEDRIIPRVFHAIRDVLLLSNADAPYTTRTPWTYFVQAGENGPIKIGSTKNLAVRMRSLCAMSPLPLRLLGVVPSDVEEVCHLQLGSFRLHGEWFAPLPAVLDFIADNAMAPDDFRRRSREARA